VAADLLQRQLAPILDDAWKAIDDEARRVLSLDLAGRKLVDFSGPFGWKFSAVNTGRVDAFPEAPFEGVSAALRKVQPLVELRVPIKLPLAVLDLVARGGEVSALDPVVKAAERIAAAEDSAIFKGSRAARIDGILSVTPHPRLRLSSPTNMPRLVIEARETLRRAGVSGPYGLALGVRAYEDLFAAAEDGYPIGKRVERILADGPIVRAPSLDGAVLLSVRGGDYELTVGQDLSIGFADRDRDTVELFLTESFTFRVLEPAAAVHLTHT
jgi:uncharacterized linocin/CFP29 family protein